MKERKFEKTEMSTMVSCTNSLDKQGFTSQFKATPAGLLSVKTDRLYTPEEVKVVNFYRFEGESNPSDNAILYAIETITGEQGTLTDSYGANSDTNITNFMNDVDLIEKNGQKE
jgi:hypothetical protein